MSQWGGSTGIMNLKTTYNPPPLDQGPGRDVQDSMTALIKSYNQAYGEAKSANEARYQQMLNIANQTTGQQAADITSQFGQKSASAMQNLARLGMANTTIAPTIQQGFQREQSAALNRNADLQQQTKLGIIERRQDPYPNAGSLQAILAGIGSQYGQGSGIAPMLQALQGMRQG